MNHSGVKKGSSTAGGAKKSSGKARPNPTDPRKSSAKQSRQADSINERRMSKDERELHSSEYARQIARRRRKRNYENNRHIRNFFYYAAITVAVVCVAIVMSTTVLFNITEVKLVKGDGVPYTDEQIMQLCEVTPGQNLFTAPYDETVERITTNLPYIEKCEIKRKLPSTVTVSVTAAQILGIVKGEFGQLYVLSTGSRAIDALPDVSGSDLPMINGVVLTSATVGEPVTADDQSRLDTAARIVKIMDGYGLRLKSITFGPNGYITANYDGRIELLIGSAANLEEKLQLAATLLLEGKITKNESGQLDLTIDKKATFRPDYLISDDE